jgi:NAD(P)-dependent dehydrogenase (short-subunit alcohol dehydrogenase family)
MPIAVVTGANRGLGLETAHTLAKRGYRVWLTGRDAASAEQAAGSLRAEGLDVRAAALDVANAASVSAFAQRMADEPAIDALVNNAGTTFQGFNREVAERTLDANYRGAVRVTDALSARLAPGANIVMVSSGMGELSRFANELQRRLLAADLSRAEVERIAEDFVSAVGDGTHGSAGFPSNAYSVSKALMNAFTRVLAAELDAANAANGTTRRVNAICPGWVKTRMGGSSAPRSLEQGASGIVWAAMLGPAGPNGGFFRDAKPIDW